MKNTLNFMERVRTVGYQVSLIKRRLHFGMLVSICADRKYMMIIKLYVRLCMDKMFIQN